MTIQIGAALGPLMGGAAMQLAGAWTLPWVLTMAAFLLALLRLTALAPARARRNG